MNLFSIGRKVNLRPNKDVPPISIFWRIPATFLSNSFLASAISSSVRPYSFMDLDMMLSISPPLAKYVSSSFFIFRSSCSLYMTLAKSVNLPSNPLTISLLSFIALDNTEAFKRLVFSSSILSFFFSFSSAFF